MFCERLYQVEKKKKKMRTLGTLPMTVDFLRFTLLLQDEHL